MKPRGSPNRGWVHQGNEINDVVEMRIQEGEENVF